MATVKNEVFIGLLHENFYFVVRELTFGGGRNCSRCRVNEQISLVGGLALSPSRENPVDMYMYM